MTEEQYRRANGTVYPVVAVIMGYVVLILCALVATGGAKDVTYVQIAVCGIALLVSTVTFVIKKRTKLCSIIMLGSAALAYLVIVTVNNSNGSFAYAYPILFAAMVFLNVKLIVAGNIVVVFGNILRLIIKFGGADKTGQQELILSVFISCIICFASIRIVRLLIRMNKENLDKVVESAKIQEENSNKMTEVAEEISELFDEAMNMLERLNQNVSTSNNTIGNIAGSTESTAESIQQQVVKCGEIQKQVDGAEEANAKMIAEATATEKDVVEGALMVDELKEQAATVEKASSDTIDVVKELTHKVNEMESFVDTILNISSQTNLLALNASIEAARAGEAGKGFAVVADEIRQLSEQTQGASNNITGIIGELNEDTRLANESIKLSVDSVHKQNELIEKTTNKFDHIKDGVGRLFENVNISEKAVKDIKESTAIIIDSISCLSATSEEIAASSTEGLRLSDDTVEDMRLCKEILEKIYQLSQELTK